MTPKKPDRFERKVEKEYQKWLKGPQVDGWLSIPLTLLRKEHAAVVRIVKNVLNESIVRDLPETGPGYQCACRHILDQLKRRVK